MRFTFYCTRLGIVIKSDSRKSFLYKEYMFKLDLNNLEIGVILYKIHFLLVELKLTSVTLCSSK